MKQMFKPQPNLSKSTFKAKANLNPKPSYLEFSSNPIFSFNLGDSYKVPVHIEKPMPNVFMRCTIKCLE